ncbi:zinc finger MYM-type protein 1-like [Cynara cardunculus var. scolymus]|uniref:zinc finger MYM-type protein 1-like n=1 Tax=Cynara cardunculus var. scolymus TaxID=59895 RepID=UPI000D62FBFC|nr:zinc finger MYM-type protein 1-like [Cynara cardunculus var. scolymus]
MIHLKTQSRLVLQRLIATPNQVGQEMNDPREFRARRDIEITENIKDEEEDLVNQNQSIAVALRKQTELMKTEYHMQLNASVEVCRYLLENALPFRGNDESEKSMYKGLFLGTLKLIGRTNGEIEKVILQNAPKNNQLTSPKIQNYLVTCFGEEVLKGVIGEIGDDVFALLVNESSDVSRKEQMAVVLRFVDKVGIVQERFVGIVHVMDTSAISLKSALDALFAKHGLSFTKVRGQGYDGASNMSVVVAVAKKHEGIKDFFYLIALVVTVVNSSCKRKDMIRESHKERIQEEIGNNEIETGKGLNQEISLVRAGDTRWNSHLKTIVSLIALFPEVIQVLKYVEDDGDNGASRLQARGLLSYLKTFEFVFYMHLISTILGLTNSLSQALQRKDEDILEAIDLIGTTKGQLQMLRENGFDQVLEKCYSFCDKHKIVKLDMAEAYVNTRNSRKMMNITNQHYYNYDIFNTVLDMQIRKFGDRFGEISTDLLQNMATLNPRNSFSQFNKSSILKLSQMYPRDFDDKERIILEHELDVYYHSIYNDVRFANLNGIADLTRLMMATRKHLYHPLVYRY